jgi:hypothetical protein
MKILVLRIFNPGIGYDQMYSVHFNNDSSIFVKYTSDLIEPYKYDKNTRILEIQGTESMVPGVLDKTVKAIIFCLENFEFDVLVRSNISTIVNVPELQKRLENRELKNLYGGHYWNIANEDPACGFVGDYAKKFMGTEYISGTSIVMSRDMCEYLIQNESKLNYSVIDDLSIGIFFKTEKSQTPNFYASFVNAPTTMKSACFYRFKTDNRINDAIRMMEMYQLLKD